MSIQSWLWSATSSLWEWQFCSVFLVSTKIPIATENGIPGYIRNIVLIATYSLIWSSSLAKPESSFQFQLTFFQALSLWAVANAQGWEMWYNGACRLGSWSVGHIIVTELPWNLAGDSSLLYGSQTLSVFG